MGDGCRYAAPPHDERVVRSTCPQSHKNGPRSMIGAGMQADVEWGAPRFCQCGDPMFAFSRGLLHQSTEASKLPPINHRRRQSIAVHPSHPSIASVNRSQLGRYGLPRGAQRSTVQHAQAQAQRLPRIAPARVALQGWVLERGQGATPRPRPCRCQKSTAA
jgi:hypothetical protein